MSRSALRSGLLILLALPGALAAQSARTWQDSTAKLAAELRALRDSMLEGDSTIEEVARRGDLTISASQHLRAEAAEALEKLVAARTRWFGGATPSPSGFRIVLEPGNASPEREAEPGLVVLSGAPDSGHAPRARRVIRSREFGVGLVDQFGEMMYQSGGARLLRWLELAPPLSMPDHERRHLAMYTVMTGTGSAQRECVAGRLDDCAYVLGLGPPTRGEPGGAYPPFLRADLLLATLELGGPGAWERLRAASTDSLDAVLSAAAGIPFDSVLARWRDGIFAFRPTDRLIEVPRVLFAVGWTGVLLLAALAGGLSRWT